VANEVSGTVTGPVVQAGSVTGGVHVHLPAPVTGIVPWQASPAPARFVNRAAEFDRIDAALGIDTAAGSPGPSGTALLITGPAGVGKSALARAWLWQRRTNFPDGLLHADLRSADADATAYRVLRGFLAALGCDRESVPTDLEGCAALYRSLTADRRIAVLLDGADTAEDVRALISGGPGVFTLVTSNRRLPGLVADGALLLAVEPLAPRDAVQMLQRFAGAERTAAEQDAAISLAALCAGMPLALSLVGAQLATHPRRTLTRLVNDLADERRRLRRLAVDGKAQMHDVIETCYRQLPPEAARMYRVLGALPIPWFSTAAAAAAAAVTDEHADALLGQLTEANLVNEHGTDAYRLHELMRLHARETHDARNNPGEARDAVDRLTRWYVCCVSNAAGAVRPYRRDVPTLPAHSDVTPLEFHDLTEALDWLDTEAAQVIALGRHCSQQHAWRTVLDLVGPLWALWAYRKQYPLWERADTLGLHSARALGDRDAEARMLRRLGLLTTHMGRYPHARGYLEDAAAIFDQLGDQHRAATVINSLGVLHLRSGDADRAVQQLTRALAIHRARGENRQIALVLIDLADAELHRGQPRAAAGLLQDAAERMSGSPDAYTTARATMLTGRAHTHTGQLDQGAEELEQALSAMRETGSVYGQIQALGYLGEHAERRDEPQRAGEHYRRAAELIERSGTPTRSWLATHISSLSPQAAAALARDQS
jgi:tetratricopeptide (TPR) repeat protein